MESVPATVLFKRLLGLETELAELRQLLIKSHGPELAKQHPGSLRGIWKGIVIDEQDFAEAKISLFPERPF
jgi:hypothetical protein